MKIWKLSADLDKYDDLCPKTPFTADELQAFDGRSLKALWKPLNVEPMEQKKKHKWGDYPGFTIPVLSERALQILQPLIENSSEELELVFDEKKYTAINVTSVLDVVDYEKSIYKTFSDGRKIMFFRKYAFRECEELKQHHIFKILDESKNKPFVSDAFKQAVEENGLTGFEFELVWDSEEQSVQEQAAPATTGERNHADATGMPNEQSSPEAEGFTYVGDLDDEVMSEINSEIAYARKLFWIPRSSEGKDLAVRVCKAVDKVKSTGRYPRQYGDVADVAIGLGCLYGHALVTGYGWKWKGVGSTAEDAVFCVVSPDENWVNPCMVYLQKILDGENENTTLLLYNMIEKTMKQTPAHKLTFLT